jgi:hypothetical protein
MGFICGCSQYRHSGTLFESFTAYGDDVPQQFLKFTFWMSSSISFQENPQVYFKQC